MTSITVKPYYKILYPIFCCHSDIFWGGGEKHGSLSATPFLTDILSPTFPKMFSVKLSVTRDVSKNIINSSIT